MFEDRPDYDSMVGILEQAKSRLRTTQYAIDWELMVLDDEKYRQIIEENEQLRVEFYHA